ncbi:hypothetical protein HKX48_007777 [Thoreauomyces humboldtii]|nr:hypothetical protein HKX48_007777 [Thoreauomyces humboldtii]
MYLTKTVVLIAAGLLCLRSAASQSIPVGCVDVTDLACLVETAQYTVIATVASTTQSTTGTSADYNATLAISCVISSFGTGNGTGVALESANALVTGFGSPKTTCPGNIGADAVVGANPAFYFLFVGEAVGPTEQPFYSLFNPCGGSVAYSPANLAIVDTVLAAHPENSRLLGNCKFASTTSSSAVATSTPSSMAISVASATISSVPIRTSTSVGAPTPTATVAVPVLTAGAASSGNALKPLLHIAVGCLVGAMAVAFS